MGMEMFELRRARPIPASRGTVQVPPAGRVLVLRTPHESLGRFEVLAGWIERMWGLLGERRGDRQVVIRNCRSIHTFGMRFAIDVAFLGRDGRVLLSLREVGPGRVLYARGARDVLERPASERPWPAAGEQVRRDVVAAQAVTGKRGDV